MRRRWRVAVYVGIGVVTFAFAPLGLVTTVFGDRPGETFVNVATSAMADMPHQSEAVCWADVDGDGDQDLFVGNFNAPSRLWRNEGGGAFVEVGRQAGVGMILTVTACAFIDLDNDGFPELFLSARKPELGAKLLVTAAPLENKLFKNNGDGTFTEIGRAAGVSLPALSSSSSDWADYDNDGDYDAFVPTRWDDPRANAFLEQVAPLRFRDIAQEKALAYPEGPQNAFLGSWFDYDGDGDLDLLLAIDWWGAELYRNDGGAFVRVTTTAFPPATDNTPGAPPNNAMGVTWGDYDNDGCFDVFITGQNLPGQGGFGVDQLGDLASRLYRGDCAGNFTDVTVEAGFVPTGVIEWAAHFIDFDNDGDLDLSVVAGNASSGIRPGALKYPTMFIKWFVKYPRRKIPYRVAAWGYRYEAMIPARGTTGPGATMPNYLYRNLLMETGRATFEDVTMAMGVANLGATRGSAWADFDNDGDLDWFIPGKGTPNRLFRNDGPPGSYLRVHLIGSPLRDAVGAWVRIAAGGRMQMRHVHILDGYTSQSQLDPHFGLGQASAVDQLWVRWPGTTTWTLMCRNVPANRTVVVAQNGGCTW